MKFFWGKGCFYGELACNEKPYSGGKKGFYGKNGVKVKKNFGEKIGYLLI